MRKIIFMLGAFIAFAGCSDNTTYKKLEQIDALLTDSKVDSAGVLLDRIAMSDLHSDRDSAYYYLIKTEYLYRKWIPTESDSAINYSLNYYQDANDREKLARAYYYEGVTIYETTNLPKAILLLKQAEAQADKTGNLLLRHKIYEKLSFYNGSVNKNPLNLLYARKALRIAQELNDKERQTTALLYMASFYLNTNNKDSAAIYAHECASLIDAMDDSDKPYLYTHLGRIYEKEDPQLAKGFLLKALCTGGLPNTYLTLSNIYLKEDSDEKAQTMWEQALIQTKDAKASNARIGIFRAMRQQRVEREDYERANALADSILKWQENYNEMMEQERIAEIQAKYDKEAAEQAIRSRVLVWGLGMVVIVLLIVGVLGVFSFRGLKARKDLAEIKVQLDAYTRKAEELESSGKASAKTISELHQKIDELYHRHSGILAKGKELFEAIEAGGTTVRWSKDDFINYLEYYKLRDLPFVNEMETGYDRLSPKYIFFAILEHAGKTDEDILRIMGVSESTLRSTRSRINSRKR